MPKVFRLNRLKMTERGSGHQIRRLSFVIILQIPKKDE